MATKTKKILKDKYKPNQFVVHPHHGAAKVIRKVNKNVEVFVEGEPKSKRIQYFESFLDTNQYSGCQYLNLTNLFPHCSIQATLMSFRSHSRNPEHYACLTLVFLLHS